MFEEVLDSALHVSTFVDTDSLTLFVVTIGGFSDMVAKLLVVCRERISIKMTQNFMC